MPDDDRTREEPLPLPTTGMTGEEKGKLLLRYLDGGVPLRDPSTGQRLDFEHAVVAGASLDGADLSRANLRYTDFSNCSLREADLRGSWLTDATFDGADMDGAELSDSYPVGAGLRGVLFREADLERSDCKGADFTDAHLEEATLAHASLAYADLTDARLQGAVLSKTDLKGANLQGTRGLEGAIGLGEVRGFEETRNASHAAHEEWCRQAGKYRPLPERRIAELDGLLRDRHDGAEEADCDDLTTTEALIVEASSSLLAEYSAPKAGDVVLGVVLEKILGQGAFGVVWRGYDSQTRQDVAVKIIHYGKLGEKMTLPYFRRGALAMQRLSGAEDCPKSIAKILHWEEARTAFSMPCYKGGELSPARIKSWSIEERLAKFRTICEAVKFAHERDVIHRDLKPANIVFSGSGFPVVTDFDIADLLFLTENSLTGIGVIEYTAPEVWSQKEKKGTVEGDVYSLGCLLYLMLVREAPFPCTHREHASQLLQKLNSALSPGDAPLLDVLKRCSRFRPSERYSSVEELLGELDEAIAATQRTIEEEQWADTATLYIDEALLETRFYGKSMAIPPKPLKVLTTLARHPNQWVRKAELYELYDTFGDKESSLRNDIALLRKQMENASKLSRKFIENRRRVGYKLHVAAEEIYIAAQPR